MELLLEREYHPSGTNGILSCAEQFCCFTIELPWLNNRPMVSCIPEGRYPLTLRFSRRHQWHLLVNKVPNRALILLHPANCALKELKGCIAPVAELTGEGKGRNSRAAFEALLHQVLPAMDDGEQVWLQITRLSDRYGHH
jgi:hypothetical protein